MVIASNLGTCTFCKCWISPLTRISVSGSGTLQLTYLIDSQGIASIIISWTETDSPCGSCCGRGACINGQCQCVPGYNPSTNCQTTICHPPLDSSFVCSKFGATYPTISLPDGLVCLPSLCGNGTCQSMQRAMDAVAVSRWAFHAFPEMPDNLVFNFIDTYDFTDNVPCRSFLEFTCRTFFPLYGFHLMYWSQFLQMRLKWSIQHTLPLCWR